MKKKVIAYVHFHWDREWYREFEIFRMRLLRAFDNVLYMLENNLLPSFYFDGQTSALLDYLEIRPEKKSVIKKLVAEEKLFIGPFYCLVDEFLTEPESFKKNIEIGLKTAKEFGCREFAGYFADTFGHTSSVIPILKEYGIDKAIVWRGCGDMPADFTWSCEGHSINTVNLIRGYFNDIFSSPISLEKKAEFLETHLDKISEKSGETLLMPIGADHLGVEKDLMSQIDGVNKLLKNYEIVVGNIFDYFKEVKDRFSQFEWEGELRDNSKTFILEGSYSSRMDIKKYNVEACYKLELANKLQKHFGSHYESLIEYAYKLLVQNQAHDSICGCSIDDVHSENITRYKKILQIANNIIDEIRFENKLENKIINLSDKDYSGTIEFDSHKKLPYQIIKTTKGFEKELLLDTQRIPVTEDYKEIYTYITRVKNMPVGVSDIPQDSEKSDVFVSNNCIGNSHIFLSVKDDKIKVGESEILFRDWKDEGDSYNFGAVEDDKSIAGKVISSKILYEGDTRSALIIQIDLKDILNVEVSLDKDDDVLKFKTYWQNSRRNHLVQFVIDTNSPISKTFSEDLGNIIEREFDSDYDIRQHLPKQRGIEVKSNNAPMRRGVCANGVGIITHGITQYEVFETELRIPLLRATGIISNPQNPSRSTPAGPPIPADDLQQIGYNEAVFEVFVSEDLKEKINSSFPFCV